MTDVSPVDRPAKPAKTARSARAKAHADAGLDLVSGYGLAQHFGVVRQTIDSLTSQGVLTRRPDGLFDQTASRLAYLKHLRSERRGSASTAAQAEYAKQKARLVQLTVARQERELMTVAEHDSFVTELIGITLAALGGWPARVAGTDLALRRKAETVLYEIRREISDACEKMATRGEP